MPSLSALQDKLDSVIAEAQSEVGQFLMQKKRILDLPNPSPDRATLMQDQTDLEAKAQAIVNQALALKTKVDGIDSLDLDTLKSIGPLLSEGTNVLAQLAQLRSAMQAHIARVDAASAKSPLPPRDAISSMTLLSPRVLLGFAVVAGLGLAGLERLNQNRKRRAAGLAPKP